MLLSNSFSGGTNGVAITTGNSGGLSGDAWTVVTGTPTYTTATGSRGPMCATITETANAFLTWNYTAAGRDVWARLYFQLSAAPSVNDYFTYVTNVGSIALVRLIVTTARTLELRNAANVLLLSISTVIPTGQWVRAEFYAHAGTTAANGAAELRLYLNADSGTLSDSATASAVDTGTAVPAKYEVTYHTGLTSLLVDDVAVTDTTWLGPVYTPTPPRVPVMVPYAPQRASRW